MQRTLIVLGIAYRLCQWSTGAAYGSRARRVGGSALGWPGSRRRCGDGGAIYSGLAYITLTVATCHALRGIATRI